MHDSNVRAESGRVRGILACLACMWLEFSMLRIRAQFFGRYVPCAECRPAMDASPDWDFRLGSRCFVRLDLFSKQLDHLRYGI